MITFVIKKIHNHVCARIMSLTRWMIINVRIFLLYWSYDYFKKFRKNLPNRGYISLTAIQTITASGVKITTDPFIVTRILIMVSCGTDNKILHSILTSQYSFLVLHCYSGDSWYFISSVISLIIQWHLPSVFVSTIQIGSLTCAYTCHFSWCILVFYCHFGIL